MWELSLYFNREMLPFFLNLKNELKIKLKDCCKSIAIFEPEQEQQFVFLLAVPFEKKRELFSIKEKICEIIIDFYKPRFFQNKLKCLDLTSIIDFTFFCVLLNFDASFDEIEIYKNLSLLNKLYLNSFINFKLKNVTKKWQEVCNLISENNQLISALNSKEDLMQFMFENSYSRIDKLTIDADKLIINEANFKTPYFINSTQFDELIIYNAIYYSPKMLYIKNYDKLNIETLNILYSLFQEKLNLIVK